MHVFVCLNSNVRIQYRYIELRSHLIDFAVAAAAVAVAAVVASHFVFLILRPFDFLLATFFFSSLLSSFFFRCLVVEVSL